MKFLDFFNKIQKGDTGLTDEYIYLSIQNGGEMIPVWGGNARHDIVDRKVSTSAKTKYDEQITIFDGEGIIISLDGSSGHMTYKNGQRFALNHHAGFITVKSDKKDDISLEYFSIFMQNHYIQMSVSDGSSTLSLDQIYNDDFELPPYPQQLAIVQKVRPLLKKKEHIEAVIQSMQNLLNRELVANYKGDQLKNCPISVIFDCLSGNTGLTEQFIYKTSMSPEERYLVLSSSTTDGTSMGTVSKEYEGNELTVFENKEGLLICRNGRAGSTRLLVPGKYTTNDHAYILSLKDDLDIKIDLRWFQFEYKEEILAYSSRSDNGTWNKTGFFEKTMIDVPLYEDQLVISQIYSKIEELLKMLYKYNKKIDDLLKMNIAVV